MFQENFVKALSFMYDKYTVDEWMEQHIEPLMKMLTGLMQRAQTLTNADIWPRRPLNFKKLSSSAKAASAVKYQDRNREPKVRYKKVDDNQNVNLPLRSGERKRNKFAKGSHGGKKRKQKGHRSFKVEEMNNEENKEVQADITNEGKENKNALLPPSIHNS